MKRLLLLTAGCLVLAVSAVRADDASSPVPGSGFPASRYEVLWKKSPFSVASAEAVPDSPDYVLAGIAQIEGVSYASVIDRKSNEHFLVSSDKPTRGFTLTSITPGHNGSDALAVVQKDGQAITLKLESQPAAGANGPTASAGPSAPTGVPPIISIPMPGSPAASGSPYRPLVPPRIHRPLIHLPPPPQTPAPRPAPAAAPSTPPPTQ
jgi:hypothetical protein